MYLRYMNRLSFVYLLVLAISCTNPQPSIDMVGSYSATIANESSPILGAGELVIDFLSNGDIAHILTIGNQEYKQLGTWEVKGSEAYLTMEKEKNKFLIKQTKNGYTLHGQDKVIILTKR